MKAEQRFQPVSSSVPAVRHFVLDVIDALPQALVERVLLTVSELATNAVTHANSSYTVRVELSPSLLRIEIVDHGCGTPELQPLQPPSSLHGRGLQIVDHLADRWGTTPSPTGSGKTVWVEMVVDARDAKPVRSWARRRISRLRSTHPTNPPLQRRAAHA